jgi:hypothetical protein
MDAHTDARYHVHGQNHLADAGKPRALKGACVVCAVRRFETFLSQTGGTREMFLSYQLTWRRKPKGTRACRESGGCPKTCRARPRKTRVTWRKPDCLNLSSQGCKNPSSDTTSWSGAAGLGRLEHRRLESPSGGRWPVRSLKGTHEAPTSRSIRRSVRESGIAYGARALWQRSLRSSPRTGEPSTWQREAGVSITQRARSA